jgi:hypothetical protein
MSLYIARFLAVFPCREIGNSRYDPPPWGNQNIGRRPLRHTPWLRPTIYTQSQVRTQRSLRPRHYWQMFSPRPPSIRTNKKIVNNITAPCHFRVSMSIYIARYLAVLPYRHTDTYGHDAKYVGNGFWFPPITNLPGVAISNKTTTTLRSRTTTRTIATMTTSPRIVKCQTTCGTTCG